MKTIFFPANEFYPTEIGGSARTIKELTKLRHNIEIYASLKGIANKDVWRGKTVQINNASVQYSGSDSIGISDIFHIMKNVRRANICYVNSVFSKYSLIAILWSILFGKDIVVSPRGEIFKSAIDSKRSFYKRLLLKILWIIKVYGLVSSNAEFAEFKKYFRIHDLRIIPNPVNVPFPKKRTKRLYKLLYLGRIAPIKNLEAIVSFNFKAAGYEMGLFGPIEKQHIQYFNSLNISEENGVSYKGVLSDSSKWDEIRNADFLVLPSHSENFGNVVVEAISQGIPAIISKGVPFDDSVYGIVLMDSVYFNIPEFLSSLNEEDWIKMSESVFEYYQGNFKSEKVLEVYNEYFDEIG